MGGGHGGSDFTIVAHTAYWIKNGAIDRQVKNATLMGRGDETLLKIDRVGKDLVLEKSGSNCGGASGICDVSTSGAAIRVSEMLIGGKGGK
jgi:TldD protein